MKNIFVNETDDFGVLLKGKSLKAITDILPNFSSCFVVNNFEREVIMLEDFLSNKEVVHFVNRLPTTPMSHSSYMAYGIEKIVFMKPFDVLDYSMLRNHLLFKVMGKKVHYLPRQLQKRDWGFGDEYKNEIEVFIKNKSFKIERAFSPPEEKQLLMKIKNININRNLKINKDN